MWEWLTTFTEVFREAFLLIGAVGRGNTFPQPLSSNEEKEYLHRFMQGDALARSVLIERNLRLVAYIARKYTAPARTLDDLVSIGTIGLIKAVDTYDPARAKNLAGYLARCIENEILMSIRSEKKRKKEVSLQDSVGVDKEGKELPLIEILDSGEEELGDQIDRKIRTQQMISILGRILNPRERLVVTRRFGLDGKEPMTQREIAALTGISRSYVSSRGYEKRPADAGLFVGRFGLTDPERCGYTCGKLLQSCSCRWRDGQVPHRERRHSLLLPEHP